MRVVLTTISRESPGVYRIWVGETLELMELTGGHKLYSADRECWVEAQDLQVAEFLQTADGVIPIAYIEYAETPVRVYNLEVEGVHSYYVGEFAVLSHNAGMCSYRRPKGFRNGVRDEVWENACGSGKFRPRCHIRTYVFRVLQSTWYDIPSQKPN